MSFNNITVLEGLRYVTNLTDLSLFHNQIREVASGLRSCVNLNVLSLGDNLISAFEPTISYLRKFSQLQVLKLEGNKIQEEPNYKSFILAHFPELKYLDYVWVDPKDIQAARDEHRDELNAKEANAQSLEEAEKVQLELKRKAELKEAKIGLTYKGLDSVMDDYKDEETKIKVLPGQNEFQADFLEKIRDMTSVFQNHIISKNSLRVSMISKFQRSVQKAEALAEDEAIALITRYERDEKQAFRSFEEEDEETENELNSLIPKLGELENHLIEKELNLVDRLAEAINKFEKDLKSIVDEIKECAKNYQENANKEVDAYFVEIETVKEEQIKAFYAENANMDNFTTEEKDVYQERDSLSSAISTLQEEYKNQYFLIEEEVTKSYDEMLISFAEEFKNHQLERNRTHLKEVMELVGEKHDTIKKALDEFS